MNDDSFSRLADALDALPNGFPRMPSGVEIRLLQKCFTHEEAELASHMTREYETAGEIAGRAAISEAGAKEMLEGLLPRRLVNQRLAERQEEYRLGPFIIGWWEAMMERLSGDREYAELTEQYFAEGGGDRIMSPRPGILGVVPVRGSLKPELLQPYDDIDAHFARYERFGVTECVCRIDRNLLGSRCRKPVTRCGFVGLPPQTPLSEHVLSREQALKLFDELEQTGHVHLGFYGFIATAESPQFVGSCNCCGDCCGILRAVTEMGLEEGPQRSNYRAVLNADNCIACGICIEQCQVNAITEGKDEAPPAIDRAKCIGCGLCVVRCSGEAIELVPVTSEEWFVVPSSFEEWEERRLKALATATRP